MSAATKLVHLFPSLENAEDSLAMDQPRRLKIDGELYCITRTNSGIFVTGNSCPHNKAPLSEGRINAYNEIICPLHEYRFDLKTGRETEQRCSDLETFPVTITESGVYLKC